MKILCLHSDFIEFEAKKKAIKEPEELKNPKERVEDCLVVFMSVEQRDESNPEAIANETLNHIKDISGQVKANNIVLYPFVHLTNSPGRPKVALEVMDLVEKGLKNFKVHRSPFGWYKMFNIKVKGHPLSELSREFGPEDRKVKKVKSDEKFELNKEKLSKQEKINLSLSFVIGKVVNDIYAEAEIGGYGLHNNVSYVDIANVKVNDLKQIWKQIKNTIVKGVEISEVKDKVKGLQDEISKDLGKDAKVFKIDNMKMVSLFRDGFVKKTNEIKAFKLIEAGSAYWKNNSANKQLTRIYSVGFQDRKDLEKYEKKVKEAEARDHRKLGKELELFSIHSEAPGMVFFHNKGTFIYNKLIDFMSEEMSKLNYEFNKTPMILNKKLWLQSGHWDHYKENMYFTKIDNSDFAVKPMNCPGNILVYKAKPHSYRDLPIKAGEYGLVHRHELSGVLSGLFRVRAFTQDDAHIFCSDEQLEEQIIELIDLVHIIYSPFGFKYDIELSTKPEKAMGDPKLWDKAEKTLQKALDKKKLKFKINKGDGAFYGPKIDFHVKDSLNRSWQCGTIQLDFSMPEKFDLTYEGKDGKKHRPIMLHRAIYGSVERFMGILIEHFNGKFPLWLNPVQVKIITITDRNIKFADEVFKKLKENGLRVETDTRSETMGKKVRDAQMERVNYIVTVGDKEMEKKTLAIRTRENEVKFGVKVDEFISNLKKEVEKKEIR